MFAYFVNLIFLISGVIIYYILLKRGYGSFVRVVMTVATLYFGPIVLLGLIFMKGGKDGKKS